MMDTNKLEYGSFIDSRDNREYKTIKLGAQVWMAENLAYMPYVYPSSKDGDGIWLVFFHGRRTGFIFKKLVYRLKDAKKADSYIRYGCLYSWSVANEICPDGWHLPSDEEWKELELYLGIGTEEVNQEFSRGTTQGNKLKKKSYWVDDKNESEDCGFLALPAGYKEYDGGSGYNTLKTAWFWTSTKNSYPYSAFCRHLRSGFGGISREWLDMHYGMSVRCIKDY